MSKKPVSPSVIVQKTYASEAETLKVTEHGIVFGKNKQDGTVGIHSDVSTATWIGKNTHVLLTNVSSSAIFVTFGAAAVATPDEDSGVPVLAGSTLILCSGDQEYIRSSAKIHCLELAD